MTNRILGNRGETLAVKYLKKHGYEILERNFVCAGGEADIIAFDNKNYYLVFVEVKTRANTDFSTPAEAVTLNKQNRYRAIANLYMANKYHREVDMRFDVIEVIGKEINHIIGAF